MKFTRTGTFNENYLDKIIDFKPKEKIQEVLLSKFDYFIKFLKKEKPDILTDYIRNLAEKYQQMAKVDYFVTHSGDILELYSENKNITPYPSLVMASYNYYIHLLQLDKTNDLKDPEVKISTRALIQAWTYPKYYFLQVLTETIVREEAIKLFKRYITHFHLDHPSPNRDKFVCLEKKLEDRLSGDTTTSEWVMVHTMLEDGKYAFKNKNCPTCVDSMVDLPDVELKYLASCYGDYEAFRAGANDHIILTMEHTIMQGDPYCSRVLHDTRIDYDLRHPPKEFWDNFEPGNEEEAKKYYKKMI